MPGLRAPEATEAPAIASTAPPRGAAIGVAAGSAAMVCVGGSVAVSSVLAGAPVYTAEAVRYGAACLLLVALARLTGRRITWPRKTEWLWLSGIAVTGLVVFNLALVEGSRHAEPAVLGVAVACVPAVLALIGPLLEGTRPRTAAVTAALTVTCGSGLVQGLGRTDAIGVAWAVAVFGCEAAFTLLAIPVLGRHGPWGVSVHATWLATVTFGVLGAINGFRKAFAVPVAVLDADQVAWPLEVRYASGHEDYLTFGGEVEHPAPGEVIFADQAGQAHARRWTNRQSGRSAVSPATSTVLIVAEAQHEGAATTIPELIEILAAGIAKTWTAAPQTAVLTPADPRFTPARS